VAENLSLTGAVIVSTPQRVATADVVRGMKMFMAEGIGVPILGVVENMAFFTPAELPNNRYYIFGKGGAKSYAEQAGVDFLGEIPLIQSIMEGGETGTPSVENDKEVEKYYRSIAEKIICKL
jgi:ATP-binding protein involved in chromosome partitioning